MRFAILFVVLFSFIGLKGFTQTLPAVSSSKPVTQQPESFAREIKKTIAVVYTSCEGDLNEYQGTAFLVLVEDARLPKGSGFGYLVTNRHVTQPGVEDGKPCRVANQKIRFNAANKDASSGSRNMIVNNDLIWTYPTDESIDLAATPFNPNLKLIDIKGIPSSLFATKEILERESVSEGDPVLYAGYFYQYPGNLQIEPIVRQGIIAMMPEEPLLTTLHKPGYAYFADAHVFGGNSGSPMFVNLGGSRNGSLRLGNVYYLLGVVSGVELEDTDITLKPATTMNGKLGANSGISVITPANQVLELLNTPKFVADRERAMASIPPAQERPSSSKP